MQRAVAEHGIELLLKIKILGRDTPKLNIGMVRLRFVYHGSGDIRTNDPPGSQPQALP
jgi:hypothetical protein